MRSEICDSICICKKYVTMWDLQANNEVYADELDESSNRIGVPRSNKIMYFFIARFAIKFSASFQVQQMLCTVVLHSLNNEHKIYVCLLSCLFLNRYAKDGYEFLTQRIINVSLCNGTTLVHYPNPNNSSK